MYDLPNVFLGAVASIIGVKQGFALSLTLGLYIDDVSHCIDRFDGLGACLVGIALYYYMLISDSSEGLQRHLNSLKSFCMYKVCR